MRLLAVCQLIEELLAALIDPNSALSEVFKDF